MQKPIVFLSALTLLGGCGTLGKSPPAGPVATGAVVPVSTLVNQIKCDMATFYDAHGAKPDARLRVAGLGGTMTLNLQRTSSVGGGVGVATVVGPINVDVSAKASRSETAANKVVIGFDLMGVEANHVRCDDPSILLGQPVLDLAALGQQLEAVVPGSPRIKVVQLKYTTNFALKEERKADGSISIVVVKLSGPGYAAAADFTQTVDIDVRLDPTVPPFAPGAPL